MRIKLLNKDKWYIILLLSGAFIFYISWVLIIPFGEAPDEVLRYDIPNFIMNHKQLPIAGDPRLIYGGYGQTYAALPFLPYLLSGVLGIFINSIGIHIDGYIIARMVSVFSGMITIYFVFLISHEVFKDKITRYFVPIFLAFTPQFTFINVYVNQDSFMIMISAVIIYLWTQGLKTNWNYQTVVLTGISCGMMMLTYLNGYVLVLSTLLIVLISYKKKLSRAFLFKLLLCVGIVFLVCGWFFIRNAYYYNGDFLGMNTLNKIAEQKAAEGFKPSQLAQSTKKWNGFAGLMFTTDFLMSTFRSFWAVLGNMSVKMNSNYYLYIAVICILSVIGCCAKFMDKVDAGFKTLWNCKLAIALVATVVGSFALHCYHSVCVEYQPQGRYMFSGMIAIFILMTAGFERLFTKRAKRIFYKIVAFTFILLDIWIGYISLIRQYLIR